MTWRKSLLWAVLGVLLALAACRGQTPALTLTAEGTLPKPTPLEGGAAGTLEASRLRQTLTPPADVYPPPQAATPPLFTFEPPATSSGAAYPLPPSPSGETRWPSVTATPGSSSQPYPGPQVSATRRANDAVTPSATLTAGAPSPTPGAALPGGSSQPYPGPQVSATRSANDAATPSATLPAGAPSPTPGVALPGGDLTPTTPLVTPTPTEKPNQPLETPPPIVGTVTLWHSWSESETLALEAIVAAFQRAYPDVRFDLLYIPREALLSRFEAAAYSGGGPALLLGPAEWGLRLYDGGLLADLSPFATPQFLASLNPAALAAGRYRQAIVGLPYAQRGVVLYRNRSIIPTPAVSWNDLLSAAQAATRDGTVGAVFERSAFFSAAHLNGIGGYLMDANGYPAFNNASGRQWLDLLSTFGQAGPTAFNSDRDVQLFEQGQAGYIVEGSWRRAELAQAIGADNLAIDPWPLYGKGSLSGFVQVDNVFLNAHVQGGDQLAALQFIGYLLTPEVQIRLAETGLIPSLRGISVRDPLIQSSMAAFERGTPYPLVLDSSRLAIYWTALDAAIVAVFDHNADPATALQQAFDTISTRLP